MTPLSRCQKERETLSAFFNSIFHEVTANPKNAQLRKKIVSLAANRIACPLTLSCATSAEELLSPAATTQYKNLLTPAALSYMTCHPTPDAEGSEKPSPPQSSLGNTRKSPPHCARIATLPGRDRRHDQDREGLGQGDEGRGRIGPGQSPQQRPGRQIDYFAAASGWLSAMDHFVVPLTGSMAMS
jgi:hypothetical protein